MRNGAEVSRRVASADGVALAVYAAGSPDAPTLLLMHGYPDNHALWSSLVEVLRDRFRVVSYDIRGTGGSDKPAGRRAYRMERLVDDLAAVIDAVSPKAPVHLVGHDWGSVQGWGAVTDRRTRARVATFTSISGPCLEYAGAWLRDTRGHLRDSLRQAARSYYVLLFQLPRLPELAIRRGLGPGALPRTVPRTDADMINGLQLYRANVLRRLRSEPVRTSVPVQLIAPEHDPFVTPAFAIGSARRWVDDLTVHSVPAGHWVVSKQPELIAPLIADFAAAHA